MFTYYPPSPVFALSAGPADDPPRNPNTRNSPDDNPAAQQTAPTREAQGDPKGPMPDTSRDSGPTPPARSTAASDEGCSPSGEKSGSTGSDCAR